MDTINVLSSDLRSKIKKNSPVVGAWVEFYDDITMDQAKKAQEMISRDDINSSLELLLPMIADWNFAGTDGKLPLTIESLSKLPSKLVRWLSQMQKEILQDNKLGEKKEETSTTIDSSVGLSK